MSGNRRLLDAFHNYEVNYTEYLEKAKILKGVTGPERDKLQGELAEWIEATCPLKERKPPKREFAESEMKALDITFGDSLKSSIIQAGNDYEALESLYVIALSNLHLDVGYIDEPEDSDYRRIASWRFVYTYVSEPDEEILKWCEKDEYWEYTLKAIEREEPLRIWYSESPRELCGFYYLCSLLKDYSGDVYAVRVPERIWYEKENKYSLVYSTGQVDPDNAGKIVETAVKLTSAELKMYAEEWERLKQENAPLRTVIAGKIVSVYEFFYDTTIWRHIPTEPKTEKSVFGEALSAMPYIQQGWLTLRIQKMIDNGQIEVVKDNKDPSKRLICKAKPNK